MYGNRLVRCGTAGCRSQSTPPAINAVMRFPWHFPGNGASGRAVHLESIEAVWCEARNRRIAQEPMLETQRSPNHLFEHDLLGKPLHTFPDHARRSRDR